jgi:hypothetical protein
MAERLFASTSDHGSYYDAVLVFGFAYMYALPGGAFTKRHHPENQSATGISYRDRDITPLIFSTLFFVRGSSGGKVWMTALVVRLIDSW